MTALFNVVLFLFHIVFSALIAIILFRILLQFFRASVHNPICHFIAKVTNPVILPLRKLLPKVKVIDLASVLLLFFVEFLMFMMLGLIMGSLLPGGVLILLIVLDPFLQLFTLLFYIILTRVILSWVFPHTVSPLTEVLGVVSEPFLRIARRFIPPIAGLDFSPMVVLIVFKIAEIVITSYIAVPL